MAYCPSCKKQVSATAQECPNCRANFAAVDGWKPLESLPLPDSQPRGLKFWQKTLWFLGLLIASANLLKLMGVGASAQILLAPAIGIFGAMYMNQRALRRDKTRANPSAQS